MFTRSLQLPKNESFFLWGPRQTGKSTLLTQSFPGAYKVDLLQSDIFTRYMREPWLLRETLKAHPKSFVIIDEVQKVPQLLDEVHWLIENTATKFALCGSSARKVKRGHANLLGGRALRYEMYGMSAYELKKDFSLERILNHGYLPAFYTSDIHKKKLSSYVGDYLKEEILAEGLVRKLPSFSKFLELAALSDTELVNYSTFARDVGISSETIKQYYEVLTDTLLGSFLPGYRKKTKRRLIQKEKFYFFDTGVVNFLAKRFDLETKTVDFGKAFENWVYHELRCYNSYKERGAEFSYWRLPSGIEIDFIINDMEIIMEAKASAQIHSDHMNALRSLSQENTNIKKKIIISLEKQSRMTEDHILILSVEDFISRLWGGEIF